MCLHVFIFVIWILFKKLNKGSDWWLTLLNIWDIWNSLVRKLNSVISIIIIVTSPSLPFFLSSDWTSPLRTSCFCCLWFFSHWKLNVLGVWNLSILLGIWGIWKSLVSISNSVISIIIIVSSPWLPFFLTFYFPSWLCWLISLSIGDVWKSSVCFFNMKVSEIVL